MDLAALSRPDRRGDLIGLGILEQVTGRAGLKRGVNLLLLHETRHRHDLDLRIALLHRGGRLDPVHRLHHQVHQHHVGETALRLCTRQKVQRRSAVARLAHHLDVVHQLQVAPKPLSHHPVIVDDKYPDQLRRFHWLIMPAGQDLYVIRRSRTRAG